MASKDLTVRLLGDATQFSKAMKGASNDLTHLGKKMTQTITPAAAAVAVGMAAVGSSFNDARDAIVTGTGASGDALDGLLDSTKRVAGQVPNDFGQVGVAIADFNTRLGLTGPELEEVSEQALNLSRITGTDVSANIRTVSRVMKDWGIDTSETSSTMDMLFKASQSTGIEVGRLGDTMVQFGAPLRQIGFSVEETTALLAEFEAQGVNTELVMGGLRQSLGRMARAGEDPISTFQRVTEEIKNAGSAGEANALALELFGARAGPDMAAAIREGRFEIDGLVADLANSEGTIQSAADGTLRLSDRFDMLKNRIVGVLGPFGEVGGMAFGAVAAMGPLVFGLGQMAPLLIKVKAGFVALRTAMLTVPWIAAAAAVAAVGLALYNMGNSAAESSRKASEAADEIRASVAAAAEEAQTAADNLARSMDAATDKGQVASDTFRDLALVTPTLAEAMTEAGVTFDDIGTAALESGGRLGDFDNRIIAAARSTGATTSEIAELQRILRTTGQELYDAASAADSVAVAAGETVPPVDASAEAIAGQGAASAEARAQLDELLAAQAAFTAEVLAGITASYDFEKASYALVEASEQLAEKTNETNLIMMDSERTDAEKAQALRDLRAEQIGVIEQALATADAYSEETGASQGSAAQVQNQIDALNALGDTHPELRGEINDTIGRMLAVPGTVNTRMHVDADGARAKIADVEAAMNRLNGKVATLTLRTVGGVPGINGLVVRKEGGPVPGGRNEPVPIMAHGGEYVLDAGTVDAIKKGRQSSGSGTGSGPSSSAGGFDPKTVAGEMAREFAKVFQQEMRAR